MCTSGIPILVNRHGFGLASASGYTMCCIRSRTPRFLNAIMEHRRRWLDAAA